MHLFQTDTPNLAYAYAFALLKASLYALDIAGKLINCIYINITV